MEVRGVRVEGEAAPFQFAPFVCRRKAQSVVCEAGMRGASTTTATRRWSAGAWKAGVCRIFEICFTKIVTLENKNTPADRSRPPGCCCKDFESSGGLRLPGRLEASDTMSQEASITVKIAAALPVRSQRHTGNANARGSGAEMAAGPGQRRSNGGASNKKTRAPRAEFPGAKPSADQSPARSTRGCRPVREASPPRGPRTQPRPQRAIPGGAAAPRASRWRMRASGLRHR